MDYTWHCASPLGRITLASDGAALVGLWFDGQAHFGRGISPEQEERLTPDMETAVLWLDAYFAGEQPGFEPPVAPRGTDFQRAVWAALGEIPYGQTSTYGELARSLAGRGWPRASARAVGGAVARNPISLIVPCHRVLGARGALTGYAGGVERKAKLLELEKAAGA